MLNIENLEKFTKQAQTSLENVVREYCQHLFLSYLYRQSEAEKLLFNGGTALRIVLGSPRFSEDLDFTGSHISQHIVEELFTNTLADIEKTGMSVELIEGKKTSGGYLGIAVFYPYDRKIHVQIEVSLRNGKGGTGVVAVIQSDYAPTYSLIHLPVDAIIKGKMEALRARHKPRDFYDYFFLLSGNYPSVRDKKYLTDTLKLLTETKIDFRAELRRFLPASQALHLRNFKKILEQRIISFLWNPRTRD